MFKFEDENLILHKLSPRAPYKQGVINRNYPIKWGQRKLLISEIEFLTLYWKPEEIPKPIVVYAGAAEGNHIPILSVMFPQIMFHLYDPRKFNIKESSQIKIFQDYFTEETCQKYKNRNDIFFISDIRTADFEKIAYEVYIKKGYQKSKYDFDNLPSDVQKEHQKITEMQIWEQDMKMQKDWVLLINPVQSLLKCHFPFVLSKEDIMDFEYFKGTVFLQCWEGKKSTETRFVPHKDENGNYKMELWNNLEYEEWLYYHNIIVREKVLFLNPLNYKSENIDEKELTNTFDSVCEAYILKKYFEHFISDKTLIQRYVVTFSRYITSELNKLSSGKNLENRRLETVEKYKNIS
jgi:hypothetical protein